MPFVEIDTNQYLYYEEYGQGIPIIFIHPPGMGNKVFHYQYDLSKHMRVIFPDLSGHGRSPRAEQTVSISFYANEVLRFMDALQTLHRDQRNMLVLPCIRGVIKPCLAADGSGIRQL